MSKKIYLNPDAIKENTIPIDKIVTVDFEDKFSELLKGYMPFSKEFSNEFSDDFAR